MPGTGMTREKLERMAAASRVGGVRRTHKAVRKGTATNEDSKLNQNLKKLGVSPIADIEEVNFIMENGTVMHFNKPKVQASIQSNTYAVTGVPQTKQMSEMVGSMMEMLGGDADALKKVKEAMEAEAKQVD